MKIPKAYLALTAVLGGLILFRYAVLKHSGGGAPMSPAPLPGRGGAQEEPSADGPQSQIPIEPEPAPAIPEFGGLAKSTEPPPAYPLRTKEGNFIFPNSQVAKLPENPPGNKPDPLMRSEPTPERKGPDPNAPPKAGKGTSDPKALPVARSPKEQAQLDAKIALARTEADARVAALLAPVERLHAAESATRAKAREACAAGGFAGLKLSGAPASAEAKGGLPPEEVLREWAAVGRAQMLCTGSLDRCTRELKTFDPKADEADDWECDNAAFLVALRAAARGEKDLAACRLVLAHHYMSYSAPNALSWPSAQIESLCAGLADALAGRGSAFCTAPSGGLLELHGDCASDFAFTRGPDACRAEIKTSKEDPEALRRCLQRAAAFAALRSGKPADCGADILCRAALRDPASCGEPQLGRRQQAVTADWCAWSTGQPNPPALSAAILSARGALRKLLADYDAAVPGAGKQPGPALESITAGLTRLAEIEKEAPGQPKRR